MKVQTKIILLLGVVVITFLAGVIAFRTFDQIKFRRIAQQRFIERNRSFDDFLQRSGEPLRTFVADYTCLDHMVYALRTQNLSWCTDNINAAELSAYRANAVWIYQSDGTPFYERNNLNEENLDGLPIPSEQMAGIFASAALRHFFIQLPQGLMEIRAGTVHPSRDFRRATPGRGYFFAGRLWNRPTLDEMAIALGDKIDILPLGDQSIKTQNDERNGSITFDRLLPGWDGKPVARLVVQSESPVVQELNRESETFFLALIVFALLLLLLLSSSLVRWVRRPLRTIMAGLKHNDPARIEPMCRDNSEFGELARTIRTFFGQRDNLIREMEERRAAEEALRKSEDELRHAQKLEAVGRLAGGVAHDFNNLLTAIVGYAELLAKRAGDDGVVREHAELIARAGEQAATLTRQLLAFSRKQLLLPRVIDLNRLVVAMEQLLQRVIGERFNLKTIPAARDGRVKADPNQLEQVLLNLSVNARDAMPNGGTLTIRTGNVELDGTGPDGHMSNPLSSGRYVVLAVTDTGAGMDEETKSRIFEPFFTTKGPGKGTGLGLSTVYGIVRQSGGAISVETAPGRGTTFRIFLPHEDAPVDYEREPPPPIEHGKASETVLVVEDEEIVRELVCDVLEEQGYHVLCAANGREALELAGNFHDAIDLLITDVVMPYMSGQELAETLSYLRPEMKVLFVSGYSDTDLGDGMLDPRVELLQKPFAPHELSQKIRDIMGRGEVEGARQAEQMQLSM